MESVRSRVEELSPLVGRFKVGKETFTRFGPRVVELVRDHGSGVFLDLKYHDIPNTVRGAARAATEMGVAMFNVHASGGLAMMQAALEGVREAAPGSGAEPKVIGVTVLTSMNQETLNVECGVPGTVEQQVLRLALLAESAGLDGIVCSAADLQALAGKLRAGFLFVTPGIKGTTTPAGDDQKRVLSPGRAISAGSSLLVIGRAITGAENPRVAAREVLEDIAGVL
jgi:orotidine-5'-phosphate decarboxylase